MSYRVTYTTDTRPTNLPEGAKVEKISALPVDIDRDALPHIRFFHLDASAHDEDVAFFSVDGVGKHLNQEQTVQVRDALNELLAKADPVEHWDRRSEPPIEIRSIRDREGDIWFRLANGKWSTYQSSDEGVPWSGPGITPADYAPFEAVDSE